jgi:hypothetical protein
MSRPRKEKPEGTVKAQITLSPEAVAIIDNVQKAARAVRFPFMSRSEIISAALNGFDKRYIASVKQTVAELGDLLSDRDHAAIEALT